MHPADKPLNRMDRLGDMAHFPPLVNAGATANVLLTLCLTWLLVPRRPEIWAPMVWLAVVLAVNLLPVLLLRLTLTPDTIYRPLSQMNFVRDQHKFSDWVYLAASANMAFWILTGWAVFSLDHGMPVLAAMLAVAFIATFSPVLFRRSRTAENR